MVRETTFPEKRKKASLAVRLFCILVISPLFADDSSNQLYTFREPHMGTEFTIRTWTQPGKVDDLNLLSKKAFDRVAELNRICSDYMPESELNEFAKAPSGKPIPVSDDLFAVFQRAGEVFEATDGAFDITAGPLIRNWRLSKKNRALPDKDKLLYAMARTGFFHLELDAENRTITKRVDGMLFDLGGIAKGYAADAALAILKEGGFPRTLVAASGDIVVGNPPPGKAGWHVGVETLDTELAVSDLPVVELSNQAISTSGDTRQFIEIDGVRYSHIVSLKTGLGLTNRIAASVIAPDATTSDSYATAVTLMGPEEGMRFIESVDGVECRIVHLENGKESVDASSGWAE